MAITCNEYGWELVFPQGLEDRLTEVAYNDEDDFQDLRDYIHDEYPIIDCFHPDCVTFVRGFDSMEEARRVAKEITADVRAWLNRNNY